MENVMKHFFKKNKKLKKKQQKQNKQTTTTKNCTIKNRKIHKLAYKFINKRIYK